MLTNLLKESNYAVVLAGISNEKSKGEYKEINLENHKEILECYLSAIRKNLNSKPSEEHFILAKWEEDRYIKNIITNKTDGLYEAAGSKSVTRLRGKLEDVHCPVCSKTYCKEKYLEPLGAICDCGEYLVPNILCEETIIEEELVKAEEEINKADLFIVLESYTTLPQIKSLLVKAKNNGGKLVLINTEPTEIDEIADYVINNKKLEKILKKTDKELKH